MTDNVAERYALLPGSPEEIDEELASLVKGLEVEVDRGESRCGQEDGNEAADGSSGSPPDDQDVLPKHPLLAFPTWSKTKTKPETAKLEKVVKEYEKDTAVALRKLKNADKAFRSDHTDGDSENKEVVLSYHEVSMIYQKLSSLQEELTYNKGVASLYEDLVQAPDKLISSVYTIVKIYQRTMQELSSRAETSLFYVYKSKFPDTPADILNAQLQAEVDILRLERQGEEMMNWMLEEMNERALQYIKRLVKLRQDSGECVEGPTAPSPSSGFNEQLRVFQKEFDVKKEAVTAVKEEIKLAKETGTYCQEQRFWLLLELFSDELRKAIGDDKVETIFREFCGPRIHARTYPPKEGVRFKVYATERLSTMSPNLSAKEEQAIASFKNRQENRQFKLSAGEKWESPTDEELMQGPFVCINMKGFDVYESAGILFAETSTHGLKLHRRATRELTQLWFREAKLYRVNHDFHLMKYNKQVDIAKKKQQHAEQDNKRNKKELADHLNGAGQEARENKKKVTTLNEELATEKASNRAVSASKKSIEDEKEKISRSQQRLHDNIAELKKINTGLNQENEQLKKETSTVELATITMDRNKWQTIARRQKSELFKARGIFDKEQEKVIVLEKEKNKVSEKLILANNEVDALRGTNLSLRSSDEAGKDRLEKVVAAKDSEIEQVKEAAQAQFESMKSEIEELRRRYKQLEERNEQLEETHQQDVDLHRLLLESRASKRVFLQPCRTRKWHNEHWAELQLSRTQAEGEKTIKHFEKHTAHLKAIMPTLATQLHHSIKSRVLFIKVIKHPLACNQHGSPSASQRHLNQRQKMLWGYPCKNKSFPIPFIISRHQNHANCLPISLSHM